MKKLLHNRYLWTLGISEAVSNVGNWVTMMAVMAMLIFRNQGGVAVTSGIFLAGLVPTLLFSPVAGWLLDRYDRKRLMIASELLSGLLVAGLIFTDNLALIYTLLALQALTITVMTPARQAVTPDLVAREDLPRANAFLQQLSGIVKIGAPVLAGALLAVVNPHTAIILDVVSFGLSALILTRLPALPAHLPDSQASAGAAPSQPPVRLFAFLRSNPRLGVLYSLLFFGVVIIISFDVLAPVFIRDVLAGSEGLFGAFIGLVGLGSLLASLVILVRRGSGRPWVDVLVGMGLLACIPFSMAIAVQLENLSAARNLALVGCLVGGFGNGLLVIQSGTLLQLSAPSNLLGRLSGGLQSTVAGAQLLGLLLTPILIPAILSMSEFLALGGVVMIVNILASVWVLRRSRPAQSEPARELQPEAEWV